MNATWTAYVLTGRYPWREIGRVMAGIWHASPAGRATGLLLLSLWLLGCGDSPTGGGGAVALKLNVSLETPSLASRIEVVTLTVRYGAVPVGPDTLNFKDGVIDDTVSVAPGDTVTFVLRALDGDGLVLYEGRDGPRQVQPGATLTLNIVLRPALLMLRAAPLYQEVDLAGQGLVDIDIGVYNVDSLFGAAFRIDYDTTVLDFVAATEGNFLRGASGTVPTWALVLKDSADVVAYAVTRLQQSAPLVGISTGTTPGHLATFRFSKRRAGTTPIALRAGAQLVDHHGAPVRNHALLVLEPATVRVIGN